MALENPFLITLWRESDCPFLLLMFFSSIPKFLATALFEEPSVIFFNTSAVNFVESDFLVGAIFTNNNFNKNISQTAIKANSNRIMCAAMASLRLGLFSRSAYFCGVY